VAQSNPAAAIDESKKEWVSRQLNDKERDSFERKAWI